MSTLDKAIHALAHNWDAIVWRPIYGEWESYYAEDRLYLIRNKKDNRVLFAQGGSPEQALESLPAEARTMMVAIRDNREEWLMRLGKEYAKAAAREAETKFIHETAVKHRMEVADEIARIGGYINEAAAKREDGGVTTDQKIDRLCKRFPCLKDDAKAKGAKKKYGRGVLGSDTPP